MRPVQKLSSSCPSLGVIIRDKLVQRRVTASAVGNAGGICGERRQSMCRRLTGHKSQSPTTALLVAVFVQSSFPTAWSCLFCARFCTSWHSGLLVPHLGRCIVVPAAAVVPRLPNCFPPHRTPCSSPTPLRLARPSICFITIVLLFSVRLLRRVRRLFGVVTGLDIVVKLETALVSFPSMCLTFQHAPTLSRCSTRACARPPP